MSVGSQWQAFAAIISFQTFLGGVSAPLAAAELRPLSGRLELRVGAGREGAAALGLNHWLMSR